MEGVERIYEENAVGNGEDMTLQPVVSLTCCRLNSCFICFSGSVRMT